VAFALLADLLLAGCCSGVLKRSNCIDFSWGGWRNRASSIVIYQYNRSVLVSTKNPEVPVTRAKISDKVDDLLFGYDSIAIGI
jgi:hypothetical protein